MIIHKLVLQSYYMQRRQKTVHETDCIMTNHKILLQPYDTHRNNNNNKTLQSNFISKNQSSES